MQTVAIIGASNKPHRYSYKAQQMLNEYGHKPIPISRREEEILGIQTLLSLSDIEEPVSTVTMYVDQQHQKDIINDIVALKPKRVIFNPGAENQSVYGRLESEGISVEEACTLVMLRTNQF